MNNAQRKFLPSKEQVVAAIYETVLRPELFDRFSPAQNSVSFLDATYRSAGARPVFEAPELAEHFSRALEILEQQWHQKNCPTPVAVLTEHVIAGFSSPNAPDPRGAKENRLWFLVSLEGDVIEPTLPPGFGGAVWEAELLEPLSWLQKAIAVNADWGSFIQRIGSQTVSWQDMLLIETSLPDTKLLCRPVWLGEHAGPEGASVAVSVEVVELKWPHCTVTFVADIFGFDHGDTQALRASLMEDDPDYDPAQLPDLAQFAAKAGAPGPAEFIRLVSFLLNEFASDMALKRGDKSPPSFLVKGSDGHETQCFRLGAETGQPVIFIHGMMDGIAGIQLLQPELRARGFRVYAPLRGGYGASLPAPNEHQQLESCVAQIEALIDQENLRRPLLLGHRTGAVFARAVALRLRDRVAGVVGVAPAPPLTRLQDLWTLQGFPRFLAICARFAPSLAPFVLARWARCLWRQGVSELVHRQTGRDDKARVQIKAMELEAVMSISLSLMMEQGGAGLLSDLALATGDWSDQMIGHAGAAIYLCGSQEALVRQQGLYPLALGADNVQLRICAGAGDVPLYVCPELVLAALEDLSPNLGG